MAPPSEEEWGHFSWGTRGDMTVEDMEATYPYNKKEQELVDRALARHEEYPPLSAHQVQVIGRTFGLALTRVSTT